MSPHALLEAAQEENRTHRQLMQQLPSVLERRRQTLQALREQASLPSKSDAELGALQREVDKLEGGVARLEAERERARESMDPAMAMWYGQMVTLAQRVKEREATLEEMQRAVDDASRQLEAKEARLQELRRCK